MTTSPTISKLAIALLKAQTAITFAKKGADNPFFHSKYADLPTVIDAIKPALNDNGIVFIQLPSRSVDELNTSGPQLLHLTTRLMHESGEWIEDTACCPLVKQDPQAYGSAITYLRRYSLAAAVGLYQDDDDANGASGHPQAQQTPKTAVSSPVRATPAPIQVPGEPLDSAGAGWRDATVPKFIAKWAGATLGEMDENDLLYWAKTYKPKPYQGRIQDKDLAFRATLDAALAELAPQVSAGQPSSNTDEDVPF